MLTICSVTDRPGIGVYLGHYCLMLCCYRLAGGDGKHAEHQQRIAEVGAAASGFGLGASRFARDRATHEALLDSLDKAVAMIDTAQTTSAFSQRMTQLMQSQGIVAEVFLSRGPYERAPCHSIVEAGCS